MPAPHPHFFWSALWGSWCSLAYRTTSLTHQILTTARIMKLFTTQYYIQIGINWRFGSQCDGPLAGPFLQLFEPFWPINWRFGSQCDGPLAGPFLQLFEPFWQQQQPVSLCVQSASWP